ncbi:putative carboxypeptidase [Yasminevirus sp. GU-2018]|uniref:Putative carboxypeptidase n=1 Tax=Yasminevirus sp. GU-2018 TaxID=2420051 RepID=A0A5K0U9C0_9VIRU|nr:putative carboxypeptidase [Yasminevirus sp. GU-2018]
MDTFLTTVKGVIENSFESLIDKKKVRRDVNNQDVPFEELWGLTDTVYTNSAEDTLIHQSSSVSFNDADRNRSVPERFLYYYRPEHIPLMIDSWTNRLNSKKVQNSVLKISVTKHDIDLKTKPFTKTLSPDTLSRINSIREINLTRDNQDSSLQKKTLLLCAGTHAREIATLNIVAHVINIFVEDAVKVTDKTIQSSSALDLLDRWNICVLIHLNPIGMYIDGASTKKCVNAGAGTKFTYYNVPGVMYRKNGRGVEIDTYNTIQTLHNENAFNFMKDPDRSMFYDISLSSDYFVDHQHLESVFYKRYNSGVDLNRNCAKEFSFDGDVDTTVKGRCSFKCCDNLTTNSRSVNTVVNWEGSNDYLSSVYPGDSPNSEPENKIFTSVFETLQPDAHITVHSYSNMIITSDMYIDKQSRSAYNADQSKSTPSKYTLTRFLKDLPYYKKICEPYTDAQSRKNRAVDSRKGGDKITRDVSASNNSNSKDTTEPKFQTKHKSSCHRTTKTSTNGGNNYGINLINEGVRSVDNNITIPDGMSPLGVVKGDHTHYAYVATNKTKFVSYTLEVGSVNKDGFYPSCTEMIEILCNSRDVIFNSMLHFDMLS